LGTNNTKTIEEFTVEFSDNIITHHLLLKKPLKLKLTLISIEDLHKKYVTVKKTLANKINVMSIM